MSQNLLVYHQGFSHNGQLWYSGTSNGTKYWIDTQVSGAGMSFSPAPIEFNNKLYVFYQGYGENNTLTYSIYTPGQGWANNISTGVSMWFSPSPVVYNNTIYVFFQESSLIKYTTYNANNNSWTSASTLSGVRTSRSPGAVKFNDALYVFHQGLNQNGEMWYSKLKNGTWEKDTKVPGVVLTDSPCPVEFNGSLYVFHQGGKGDGELWYFMNEDQGWTTDRRLAPKTGEVLMSFAPAVVVYNSNLYVFHQGYAENGELWVTFSTDGNNWTSDAKLGGIAITESPGVISTTISPF